MNAITTEAFLIEDQLKDLERMAAGDLVMKARNVEQLSRRTPNRSERLRYASAFARVRDEMAAAVSRMERVCPDLDVPEFIAEGSTVDLAQSRRSFVR